MPQSEKGAKKGPGPCIYVELSSAHCTVWVCLPVALLKNPQFNTSAVSTLLWGLSIFLFLVHSQLLWKNMKLNPGFPANTGNLRGLAFPV